MKPHLLSHRALPLLVTAIAFLHTLFQEAEAYTVTSLTAEYHNGQVFLTWTNPSAVNLQYNIYRSGSKFTESSQLTSSKLLGFVRDSSSKNYLWTKETGNQIFYKITDTGQPLAANRGLYVATSTEDKSKYYAVTVTDLSTNIEDKTIILGTNSLSASISETIAEPQPVWQDSIEAVNGEMKQRYVQYFDNLETSLYPQMNSNGSYAANFFLVKRGSATKYPLFIVFNGHGKDADKSVPLDNDRFSYGYILSVFDWLPIPTAEGDIGDNTFYSGYHKNFNMYSDENPVPSTGVVKMFVQRRIWESVKWVEANYPIDTTRRYVKGTSSSGYGSLLTGTMYSEKIAAIYSALEPTSLSPKEPEYEQMWGLGSTNLNTDVVEWNSSDTLQFKDLTNIAKLVHTNKKRDMPPIYDIHGKNDITVPWNDTEIVWYDSLRKNRIGGARYFDQRDHGGNGKNFIDDETEPNYYRFATNIPYPAFSNCSIDQDPGNGTPSNGDDYGSQNGYLEWNDDDFKDVTCKYVVHVFLKDLYVGGVLDVEQYTTCTVDITARRCQVFDPPNGCKIKWWNYDEITGVKLQNGSFTYTGGLITIKDIIVNKVGNKIRFSIDGCVAKFGEEDEDDMEDEDDVVSFSKSPNGYTANIDLTSDEQGQVFMYDLLGRLVWVKNQSLTAGTNEIEIPSNGTGIYLVQVKGETFSQAEKLLF